MPALLKAVTTELAKYKLDFVVVEVFRLKTLGTEWAVNLGFFLLKWK
jgi:hypothetical protein